MKIVDDRVTKRSYKFAQKCKIPIYFTSAASGVNVVKVNKLIDLQRSNFFSCGLQR